MFGRIRQWHRRLGGFRLRDLWWGLQILGLVTLATLVKSRVSIPRLVRLFDARPRPTLGGDWQRLNLITRGLLRRTLRRDFCLPHALVLFHFGRRWGYPTRIFIGARKNEHGLDGHAWVRIDGTAVPGLTPPENAFTTFYAYPETPS